MNISGPEPVRGENELMSSSQREFFAQQGYLVLPNALSGKHCESLKSAASAMHVDTDAPLNMADILARDDAFLDLIDIPHVLGKVCEILGWNIWVNHSHVNIYPPEQERNQDRIYYGWHRDGGSLLDYLDGALAYLKVAFYLTDVLTPEAGQTYVIPGSHLRRNLTLTSTGSLDPAAKRLAVGAGTAIIYHPRLIHSIHSPNYSRHTRVAVFVQWACRWLYPLDPMSVDTLADRVTDPVRRQLLGFTTRDGHMRDRQKLPYAGQNRSGRYYPAASEVPLRELMIERWGMTPEGRVWTHE